jgi:hypothetical protein
MGAEQKQGGRERRGQAEREEGVLRESEGKPLDNQNQWMKMRLRLHPPNQ